MGNTFPQFSSLAIFSTTDSAKYIQSRKEYEKVVCGQNFEKHGRRPGAYLLADLDRKVPHDGMVPASPRPQWGSPRVKYDLIDGTLFISQRESHKFWQRAAVGEFAGEFAGGCAGQEAA